MENDKHYFFVGVFVIATTIAIMLFAVWLGSSKKGEFTEYRIFFSESVSGLSVGGAVKYRGVNVGSVTDIKIDRENTSQIRVDISIDRGTPIKTDTVAGLKFQGVTGVIFIELSGGTNEAALLAYDKKSDETPVIKAKSSPINALVDRMPELLDRISNGVEQINKMVSDENIGSITDILAEWKNMSYKLSNDINQIDPLLRELKKTSVNINNLTESLDEDPSRLIFPAKQKGVPAP